MPEAELCRSPTEQELYPVAFLEKICDRIGIAIPEEQGRFMGAIERLGNGYLYYKEANSGRIQPAKQKVVLENYRKALENVQERYREVQEHTATSAKLHKSLKQIVLQTEEPSMRDMFHPYVDNDQGNMAVTLFDKFIDVLIEATIDAPNQDIGKDKANMSGDFIAWWVASLRNAWPKNAAVKFGLGDYDADKGKYHSESADILDDLLCSIDKDITEGAVVTAMRKVIKAPKGQAPAFFLIT